MRIDGDRPLDEVTFVAFDTETTGLNPIAGKLVEVGAVRFRSDGQVLEAFAQLIDPQDAIPADVQRVHGITDRMVHGQPVAEEVLPFFLDFLGSPDTILLAHNAPFDINFIGISLLRVGLDCPTHRIIDTLQVARSHGPVLASYALENVAAALGAPKGKYHRALADASLVKIVFLSLLQRLPAVQTVADLHRMTTSLSFSDAGVGKIAPPAGFEELAIALQQGQAIAMVYEGGFGPSRPRTVTPRALLAAKGVPYLAAHCHIDGKNKLFRLDRIREFRMLRPLRPVRFSPGNPAPPP